MQGDREARIWQRVLFGKPGDEEYLAGRMIFMQVVDHVVLRVNFWRRISAIRHLCCRS